MDYVEMKMAPTVTRCYRRSSKLPEALRAHAPETLLVPMSPGVVLTGIIHSNFYFTNRQSDIDATYLTRLFSF